MQKGISITIKAKKAIEDLEKQYGAVNTQESKGFLNGVYWETAHYWRHKPHFDFGEFVFPIVPYRHSPQALRGLTADCRSLV